MCLRTAQSADNPIIVSNEDLQNLAMTASLRVSELLTELERSLTLVTSSCLLPGTFTGRPADAQLTSVVL